jgi:3-methyladenine DNA glycosylase Tag
MINDVKKALDDARMIPGTEQAKEMNARLAQVQSMIDNNGVSFTAFEKMRGIFNDLKTNKDPDLRRLGGIAVSKIDNYISNVNGKDLIAGQGGIDKAVASVVSARKDWRNASRASILDDALNVAEARALDPKASESELIRRGFINIAADKNKMNAFTKNEQNIIKSVAKGGSLDPLLSSLARFSPLRSQLVTAGAIPAYTQMPATTMAVLGGGLAADIGQGMLRSRAANQAVRQIASGAVPTPQPNLAYRGLLSSPAIDLNSLREPQE